MAGNDTLRGTHLVSAEGQARIVAAIEAAEARTSGEIVCTVADEAHRYVVWILILSVAAAFFVPLALAAAGWGPSFWAARAGRWAGTGLDEWQTVTFLAAMQAAVLLGTTALLWWSPFAQRRAPRRMRAERVHDAALRQFVARDVSLAGHRAGVLLYVSLRDRIVDVVATPNVSVQMSADDWADTVAALLAGLRRDDLAGGFVDAIDLAGALLARHFPGDDQDEDMLPNHLIFV